MFTDGMVEIAPIQFVFHTNLGMSATDRRCISDRLAIEQITERC